MQHSDPGEIVMQKLARVVRDMTRSIVPDQMNQLGPAMLAQPLGERPAQVNAVVLPQDPTTHLAGMHNQRDQQVNCPPAIIFKLASLNLSGAHQFCRTTAFKRLDVRLLVQTDHQFITRSQIKGLFVAPQPSRRPLAEFFMKRWSLPGSRAMWLQVGITQNQRNGRVRNPWRDATLHCNLRQTTRRPMGHLQPDANWIATSQLFNFDSLQRGKKLADDLSEEHQRLPRPRFPHHDDRDPRWYVVPARTVRLTLQR